LRVKPDDKKEEGRRLDPLRAEGGKVKRKRQGNSLAKGKLNSPKKSLLTTHFSLVVLGASRQGSNMS